MSLLWRRSLPGEIFWRADFVIGRRIEDLGTFPLIICMNNGEALIKKVQKDGDSIILSSLNQAHPPFLASNDFRIVGEVRGVISREG